MIEPQVEHGGASSWFWMAAKEDFFVVGAGAAAVVELDELPELLEPPEPLPGAVACTSSTSCSGVVGVSAVLTPARYCASGDRNFTASHRKM